MVNGLIVWVDRCLFLGNSKPLFSASSSSTFRIMLCEFDEAIQGTIQNANSIASDNMVSYTDTRTFGVQVSGSCHPIILERGGQAADVTGVRSNLKCEVWSVNLTDMDYGSGTTDRRNRLSYDNSGVCMCVRRCTFLGMRASGVNGGAIYIKAKQFDLTDSQFTDCYTNKAGGAIAGNMDYRVSRCCTNFCRAGTGSTGDVMCQDNGGYAHEYYECSMANSVNPTSGARAILYSYRSRHDLKYTNLSHNINGGAVAYNYGGTDSDFGQALWSHVIIWNSSFLTGVRAETGGGTYCEYMLVVNCTSTNGFLFSQSGYSFVARFCVFRNLIGKVIGASNSNFLVIGCLFDSSAINHDNAVFTAGNSMGYTEPFELKGKAERSCYLVKWSFTFSPSEVHSDSERFSSSRGFHFSSSFSGTVSLSETSGLSGTIIDFSKSEGLLSTGDFISSGILTDSDPITSTCIHSGSETLSHSSSLSETGSVSESDGLSITVHNVETHGHSDSDGVSGSSSLGVTSELSGSQEPSESDRLEVSSELSKSAVLSDSDPFKLTGMFSLSSEANLENTAAFSGTLTFTPYASVPPSISLRSTRPPASTFIIIGDQTPPETEAPETTPPPTATPVPPTLHVASTIPPPTTVPPLSTIPHKSTDVARQTDLPPSTILPVRTASPLATVPAKSTNFPRQSIVRPSSNLPAATGVPRSTDRPDPTVRPPSTPHPDSTIPVASTVDGASTVFPASTREPVKSISPIPSGSVRATVSAPQTASPLATVVPPATFSAPATDAAPVTLAPPATASVPATQAPPATISPLATVFPLSTVLPLSTIPPLETVSPPASQSLLPIASTEGIESLVVSEQQAPLIPATIPAPSTAAPGSTIPILSGQTPFRTVSLAPLIPAPTTRPFPSACPFPSIGPHYATDAIRTTVEVASGETYASTYSPVETRTTAPPSSLVVSTVAIAESVSLSWTTTASNMSTPTGSRVAPESERNEASYFSNQPNAAQEGNSENTPLMVVSVILIIVMIVLFALLIYREHNHNEFLQRIDEKKEQRPPEKAVQLRD
jgi:hypothetical protein